MFDKDRGAHVTFNAPVLPVSLDPETFEEHLDFATWYTVISSTRRTDRVRQLVRRDLAKYSLMELRAIFLFAVKERELENAKGEMLNPIERAGIWQELYEADLTNWTSDFSEPPLARPVATETSLSVVYPNN